MKASKYLLAVLAALILGGCASVPGAYNGLGKDWMTMMVIYRTDHQPLTPQQYVAITHIAKEQGMTLSLQLSSAFEASATSAGAYGAAGFVGGATQPMFYDGVSRSAASGYTGTVYALAGIPNGLQGASYANVAAIATMVEQSIRDAEKYNDGGTSTQLFKRVHVVAAYIRSRNTESAPAPGLVPHWSGQPSGR